MAQYGLYISLVSWYTIALSICLLSSGWCYELCVAKTLFELISFIFRGVGARSVVPSPHFGRPSLWSILLIGKIEWRTRRVIYYQYGLVKMEARPNNMQKTVLSFSSGSGISRRQSGNWRCTSCSFASLSFVSHESRKFFLSTKCFSILLSITSSFHRLSVSRIFSSIAISILLFVSVLWTHFLVPV